MNRNRERVGKAHLSLLTFAIVCCAAVNAWAGNVLNVGPSQTYATIQAAVNAAQPGDAIMVYPSTYPESVTVAMNHLSILAEEDGVVVGPPPAAGQACFEVKADGVVIQGFGLTGTNCAPAIRFEGSYNRFSDNNIYGLTCPGVNGLACRAPKGGSNYNVIQNNDLTEADLGIVVGSDDLNAVNKGNAIIGNRVHGVGAVGIAVYNAIETTIQGNVIEGVAFGMGISLSTLRGKVPQHGHLVVGNSISYTSGDGIDVFSDQNCSLTKIVVSNNEIVSPGGAGILFQKDPGARLAENMISGNVVSDSEAVGIVLDEGVNKNTVEGNLTFDGGLYGILAVGNHNKIVSNTALRNSTYDLTDSGKGNTWKDNVYQTCSW